jgi:hypothetical protein
MSYREKLSPCGQFVRADIPPTNAFDLTKVKITKCPTRVALGARRAKSGCPGGAESTMTIASRGFDQAKLRRAARGRW